MEEWMNCESRGPWVRNSLKHRVDELRSAANKARKAYRKDFMGKPCGYIADAYDEAAALLQQRLDAVTPNALGQEPCAAVCARSPAPEGYTSGTTEKE